MPTPTDSLDTLEAFRSIFGERPTCPHCGGWMYFERDEYQPVAICLSCAREIPALPIPPLETISEVDARYYVTGHPLRRF